MDIDVKAAAAAALEPLGEPMSLAEMEEMSEAASVLLKSLANPIRLRILCLMVEGEIAVGSIAARLQLREALVSQHLTRLRHEEVVKARRVGTSILYSLWSEPATAVLQTLHRHFCEPHGGAVSPQSRHPAKS